MGTTCTNNFECTNGLCGADGGTAGTCN
jgi:hypothetical protein